ncbi:hypothetical protein FRC08_000099 [Ceratobasidium sp. 394]|nr:hypothetical protein FRC08_000099 [Ceratobasidium sp. 394]
MTDQNKKYNLDNDNRASWTKANASAFVKDVEELQGAIKYCAAFAFTEALSKSLDQASMERIQLVKEVVSPFLLDGHTDSRHCVRCHQAYTEKDNHEGACIIRCAGNLHHLTLKADPEQLYYLTECCGRVFKHATSLNHTKLVCIEERHTDNPDLVDFFDLNYGRNAKHGKPVPLGSNNPTVLTCEAKGCGK